MSRPVAWRLEWADEHGAGLTDREPGVSLRRREGRGELRIVPLYEGASKELTAEEWDLGCSEARGAALRRSSIYPDWHAFSRTDIHSARRIDAAIESVLGPRPGESPLPWEGKTIGVELHDGVPSIRGAMGPDPDELREAAERVEKWKAARDG